MAVAVASIWEACKLHRADDVHVYRGVIKVVLGDAAGEATIEGDTDALAVPHNGPDGVRPDEVRFTRIPAPVGTDSVLAVPTSLRVVAFDTTNDEVDVTAYFPADEDDVAYYEALFTFYAAADQDGISLTSSGEADPDSTTL